MYICVLPKELLDMTVTYMAHMAAINNNTINYTDLYCCWHRYLLSDVHV